LQVLYDLGVVSTKEPFGRLVSQGMILGEVEYTYAVAADGKEAREDDPHATIVKVRHCSMCVEYVPSPAYLNRPVQFNSTGAPLQALSVKPHAAVLSM
jgi:leucyl-tRNA synthetase